jgi:glycosyltransferase involved in cell wall biosynthesis
MSRCHHPGTSVVIPTLNADKTLAVTLDSLLAQSDSDWGALIVDDGLTGETATLITSDAPRDGRFVGLAGAGDCP